MGTAATKKITELTPEQEVALPAFREQWRAVGLSTDPIHADAARKSVRALYAAAGEAEPDAVIVLASPMACLIAREIISRLSQTALSDNQRAVLEKRLWGQLRDQLWDQLRGQLWDQLRDQLGDQLRGQLWGQLRDQLWGQLRDQLRGQLWDQLRDQLWDQLRGQKITFQQTYTIGGQDAFWLAFYEYGERIGAKYGTRTKAHFDAYRTYALTCGWLYPYKNIAFVCDRPEQIHFDESRRLHCEAGMAVRFRDGWGLHAWRGMRVPAHWIEQRDTLSAADVFKEPNAELRRTGCEILGWDRVLSGIDAKLIDDDGDPQIGTLYEGQIPGAVRCGFLKVECGTKRTFVIPTPAGMRSAIEAQAWIQQINPNAWVRPEVRG